MMHGMCSYACLKISNKSKTLGNKKTRPAWTLHPGPRTRTWGPRTQGPGPADRDPDRAWAPGPQTRIFRTGLSWKMVMAAKTKLAASKSCLPPRFMAA